MDRLALRGGGVQGSGYTLTIIRASASEEQTFKHSQIALAGADTHWIAYGAWDGVGALVLQIDHGSDGTIDETMPLVNQQTRKVYLPLVQR